MRSMNARVTLDQERAVQNFLFPEIHAVSNEHYEPKLALFIDFTEAVDKVKLKEI